MNSKNLIAAFIIAAIIITTFSCKDTGTGPTTKPYKDPREMTWTADTLSPAKDAVQLIPVSMRAFAPNDVWLACWSDVAQKVMWHYDGKTWTESDIEGQSGPIGLDALAGNSSSDLWAGGFYGIPNSFVALSHYNGKVWSRVDPKMPGEILSMCSDPTGNIWACGNNGVVMKYAQDKWTSDTLHISDFNPNDCFLYSINYNNGNVYILARNNANTLFAYLSGDIKSWTVKEIFPKATGMDIIKWGTLGSFSVSNGKLYSFGLAGVWQLGESGWNNILDFHTAIQNLYGISESYIIGVGAFKTIMFYDGTSWQSIIDRINVGDPNFVFNKVWTDGNEIIATGWSTINGIQKTVIWHGK